MRSVSLSKYLSKSIHVFTTFVYLFTFLGPSLALATNASTYEETREESETPRSKTASSTPPKSTFTRASHPLDDLPSALQDIYHRFDLKVDQDPLSGGIHFRLRDFDGRHSLSHHVIPNDDKESPFKRLIEDGIHTGFTVNVPDVGQIQCDWQGNLKLVGLHRMSPEASPLALLLATDGNVEFSHVTFKNLALQAKTTTFVQGIKIQEESVFDIDVLDLAGSLFENTHMMTFLSKTRFVSKKIWRNKGQIIGDDSLDFDRTLFSNPGTVYSKDRLSLSSVFFDNDRGTFYGEKGTTLNLTHYFYNKKGGKVSSGKVTHLTFDKTKKTDLGDIHGEEVVLEDLSGGYDFSLRNGRVEGTHSTTLIGKYPSTKGIDFVTPQLILDAYGFDLGVQKHVKRTVVKRSKGRHFTLTRPYKTAGTLEFWQEGLTTREAVRAAMLDRFGDETGKMPKHYGVINLRASVKAAGGLMFFTPFAKVRLGDNEKTDEMLKFIFDEGWIEGYATEFDLEKGTLVAKNAHIHAPGGIKLGRLVRERPGMTFSPISEVSVCFNGGGRKGSPLEAYVTARELEDGTVVVKDGNVYDKDGSLIGFKIREMENVFSQKFHKQNGSTVLVRGTTTLRGPWHHRADFLTSFLILNSPKTTSLKRALPVC